MIICIFILLIIIFYFFYNIKKITNNNDDIIFITSYRDIGRDKWTHMKRTNKNYYDWFNVLGSNIDYKLIVYINDDIKNKLSKQYFLI